MMNSRRIAQKWADEHSTETAKLEIVTDGRSGYGQYVHEYYVDRGQVARAEINSVYDTRNGVCAVCGRLYLFHALKRVWAPDPDAGQLLPEEETGREWLRGRVVRAHWASVIACPDCVKAHQLDTRAGGFTQGPVRSGWIGEQYHVSRAHPTLNRYGEPPIVCIDERPCALRQRRAADLRGAEAAV